MKLSVACNFDETLIDKLCSYPVYEVYGKLTADYFGGGRPSFFLPEVDREMLDRFVGITHQRGLEFNYLLNTSTLGNLEYTRGGQQQIEAMLEWLDGIGVDSVTVANIYLLRLVKHRYPRLKVRISSHCYTDNARKVRFWVENGADLIVVSEVNVHREFRVLEAMRRAAGAVELQLIVNNWCRQDCAIAGNHAVALSSASQRGSRGFPLDYCSLICNQLRLNEPVNYIRANWIRPEDLHLYEDIGFHSFKIVERNTPTQILLERTRAYAERRYQGNLLDLVQNYAYPQDKLSQWDKDACSYRRLFKYFIKPQAVNLIKFRKVMEFGQVASVLYPLRAPNPVQIDNRALDGFIDYFKTKSCQNVDCENCRYCHEWAERVVKIDPAWKERMAAIYRDLLSDIDHGSFWDPYLKTIVELVSRLVS
jgi:collagenase-like PrtC family protease